MRALITGGKGFVGHWLAAHLKDRGDEVAVIDIETDVADGAAVRRVMADVVPEAVYHLAAMTHVGESWENPGQVLRVNVLGTAEILAAARSIGGSPTCPRRQLGRGLRGRHPGAAAHRRGHAYRARQSVRRQQAGGGGGRVPGVARLRPTRRRRAALQPHRPGPVAKFLRSRTGQADRGRHPERGPVPAGGDADHPARLHRRARCGGGLPAPDRTRCPRAGLQRLFRPGRRDVGGGGPAPRAGRGGPHAARPTPLWCGRSTCPCCAGVRSGSGRRQAGCRRSPSRQRSPTS